MTAQLRWFEQIKQAVVVTQDKVCRYHVCTMEELDVAIKVLESMLNTKAVMAKSKNPDVFIFNF